VVAVPPPAELERADQITGQAVAELDGIRGAGVTPRLLARVAEVSEGRSVALNVDLVIQNARVATQVALAFAT